MKTPFNLRTFLKINHNKMNERLKVIRQECVYNGIDVISLELEAKLVLILQGTPLRVRKLFHKKLLCLTNTKEISDRDTYLYSVWFLAKMEDKVSINFMVHYNLIESILAAE
mgnify:CR=1 FL=1